MLLASAPGSAQDANEAAAEGADGLGDPAEEYEGFKPYEFSLLPFIGYSSDIGFVGALVAQLYHYEEGVEPYRDTVRAVAVLTSKLVQFYEFLWERVGLFGKPLRLELLASFTATPVGHYCGVGNRVTCSRRDAERDAARQGFVPGTEEHETFLARYYRFRVMRPAARATLRWAPFRNKDFEFIALLNLDYGVPGFYSNRGPYAGSRYGQDFPDGERGLLSELRVGFFMDRRDNERRPTRGYVWSTTARVSSRVIASRWNYGGINAVAAGYYPLTRNERLVVAGRGMVDLIFGDAPTTSLGSVGGFWSDLAFGGQQIGRGVRGRRFIGRIKVLAQAELRWAAIGKPGKFQLLLQAFADFGWVGLGYRDFGGDLRKILVSFGGGVGAYWAKSFVFRFDVGLSPEERYDPQFYVSVLHPF